jgi:hypothetical protein
MMSKQELNGNETIPSPPASPGTAPPVAAAEHWRVHRPMVFGATMRIGVHVLPERWQHVPGRVVLTIDQAGRVHKETQ